MPSNTASEKTYEVHFHSRSRSEIGLFLALVQLVSNVYTHWDLTRELFVKNFVGTYKKSALGLAWLFFAPLIGILSWAFMNATGILQPGDVGIPYPAYILISFTIWGLFAGFLMAASGTLEGGLGFISQVEFPHEVLFVQQCAGFSANFFLTFVLNLGVLFYFDVIPDWKILLFPFLVSPLFFLGGGLGLLLSVLGAVAADFKRMVTLCLGFLMFLTPVVYSSSPENPLLAKIVNLNPLTTLLVVPRDLILFGHSDDVQLFLVKGLVCFIIFAFSWKLFFVSEKIAIEKMY